MVHLDEEGHPGPVGQVVQDGKRAEVAVPPVQVDWNGTTAQV
jgi:hypothetical protein